MGPQLAVALLLLVHVCHVPLCLMPQQWLPAHQPCLPLPRCLCAHARQCLKLLPALPPGLHPHLELQVHCLLTLGPGVFPMSQVAGPPASLSQG